MPSTLQEFLKRRIIDIDADDEQFKNMEKAASELAKILRSKRIEIVHHTLVALDPATPADEPRIIAAFDILQKFWKAAPKRYPETPVTELRAIIAEALRRVCDAQDSDAALVSLTASSYGPHAAVGEEQPVWLNLLTLANQKSERVAAQYWGDGTTQVTATTVPTLSIPPLSLRIPSVDPENLSQHLRAAAGSEGGETGTLTRNQHSPSDRYGNVSTAWVNSFGTIAGKAIAAVMNQALTGAAKGIQGGDALQAAMQHFGAELATSLGVALAPLNSTMLRTHLLWWRESRYSPRLRRSYLDLDTAQVPLAVALDLHSLVPLFTPRSVDFFLRHSIELLLQGREGAACWTVDEYAQALGAAGANEIIALIPKAKLAQGRITLLGYLRHKLLENSAPGPIRERLGLDGSTCLSPAEIGAWIFRDLQAERIASQK